MPRCSRTRGASIGLDGDLEVSRDEIEELAVRVPPKVRAAIAAAARNIEKVARRQRPQGWTVKTAPGVTVEQRVTPLDRVGCYVPGGRYPLPSSLLMTAIPARAAGVREIIVACPRPAPVVMAAARAAGVTRLFRMGGAQAIAAMAYGTKTVPRVDKIVGPGNQYVAAAKALVATDCAIDFYAGPTEIVIVSDKGNPEWIAADLIAQAEHDPQARALLITTSRQLASEGCARGVRADADDRAGARIARAPRRHHHRRQPRRSRGARQSRRRRASRVRRRPVCDARCGAAGAIFVGLVHGTGRGRLRDRLEPRAADQRRRAFPRRPAHRGFRARVDDSADDAAGARRTWRRPSSRSRAQEGLEAHARSIEVRLSRSRRGTAWVAHDVRRPADRAGALRLHLNENTGGCSQAVIDAIRQISAEDVAYYPDYAALVARMRRVSWRHAKRSSCSPTGWTKGCSALTVSAFRAMQALGRAARSDRSRRPRSRCTRSS